MDIAVGAKFSVAVDKNGYVYTFGKNTRGVLGINRTNGEEDLLYYDPDRSPNSPWLTLNWPENPSPPSAGRKGRRRPHRGR